jgi:hypothetical protein
MILPKLLRMEGFPDNRTVCIVGAVVGHKVWKSTVRISDGVLAEGAG